MTKVSVVGRWPLAAGLSVMSSLGAARTAHAGTWSGPVYAVTGRTPADSRPVAATWPNGGGEALKLTRQGLQTAQMPLAQ